MTGAAQHAALPVPEWKDVARSNEVCLPGLRVGQELDGAGAIFGRDTRRNSALCINGDGERGSHRLQAVLGHQGEFELIQPLRQHWNANDPGSVPDRKSYQLGRCLLGRKHEIAFISGIGVIGEDNNFAVADIVDHSLDRIKRHNRN